MNKAVFIDKDGTLIKDVPYNVDPALIELQPNAGEALKQLQEHGFNIIVISNQSGVARGLFPENKLQDVEQKISRLLGKYGVMLNGFYYCPHLSSAEGTVEAYCHDCRCRKPEPGLLLKAATAKSIKLTESWMIGDILNDIEAGNRAGCKSMLLDNGGETEWELNDKRMPDIIVKKWSEGPQIILENHLTAKNAKMAQSPQGL